MAECTAVQCLGMHRTDRQTRAVVIYRSCKGNFINLGKNIDGEVKWRGQQGRCWIMEWIRQIDEIRRERRDKMKREGMRGDERRKGNERV